MRKYWFDFRKIKKVANFYKKHRGHNFHTVLKSLSKEYPKMKIWNFGRIMAKDLTQEQLTPGLETGTRNWDLVGPLSARNFWSRDYHSYPCANSNWYRCQKDLCSETFPKSPHKSNSDHKHSIYGGQVYFSRRGSRSRPRPETLGLRIPTAVS
jgi:hypothetical protein